MLAGGGLDGNVEVMRGRLGGKKGGGVVFDDLFVGDAVGSLGRLEGMCGEGWERDMRICLRGNFEALRDSSIQGPSCPSFRFHPSLTLNF